MKRLLKALLYTLLVLFILTSLSVINHYYPIVSFSICVLGLFGVFYWILE